jgi:putative SOS response-associated peptidase YedK
LASSPSDLNWADVRTFQQSADLREIVALYHLSVPATPERNLPARYNICPTTTIDVVIERNDKRELVPMRWGLVPSWWKKILIALPSTFNARAETVVEKPMFRFAFRRSRCLIPASVGKHADW